MIAIDVCGSTSIPIPVADLLEVLIAPLWAAALVFVTLGVIWMLRGPLKRSRSSSV
jgi:hypothetical protein